MRLYLEAGGNASKCIMSHLDRMLNFLLTLHVQKKPFYKNQQPEWLKIEIRHSDRACFCKTIFAVRISVFVEIVIKR